MPRTCKTCKRTDASEINAMVIQGISFRNIITKKDGGQRQAGLKRNKDKCLREMLGEVMIERRGGLLLSRRPVAADRVEFRQTSENRIRHKTAGSSIGTISTPEATP